LRCLGVVVEANLVAVIWSADKDGKIEGIVLEGTIGTGEESTMTGPAFRKTNLRQKKETVPLPDLFVGKMVSIERFGMRKLKRS